MPHKHTRRDQDDSQFDLPPTRIARPLTTGPAPKKTKHKRTTKMTSTTKPRKMAEPEDTADVAKPDAADKTTSKSKLAETADAKNAKKPAADATTDAPAADKPASAPAAKKTKDDDPRGIKRKREATKAAAKAANKGSVSAATPKGLQDTPRAFRRLMAIAGGKRVRPGLDNGPVGETKRQKKERLAKERAAAAAASAAEAGVAEADIQAMAMTETPQSGQDEADGEPEKLKIRPGEKMADFVRRVDAALPLAGVAKAALPGGGGNKDPLGLVKQYRTKQERKLHKLYDQWRVDDEKIKARKEEALAEREEEDLELDETFGSKWRVETGLAAAPKKARKNMGGSGNRHADDDIWGDFNRKRAKAMKATVVRAGIHNVVGAPPERLTRIDTSKFKFATKKKGVA